MHHTSGTLAASHVTKSYGADVVLDDVTLVVPPAARIGVVGPNGSGKTTLLRVLAGEELPDAGRVERRPPSLTVGYLPQDVPPSGVRVGAFIGHRGRVPDEEHWRIGRAASKVGLDVELDRPLAEVSGGQLTRVKLAALVAMEADVLLLDEATNDLDFDGLAVLERFVASTESALVVVSHDRAFLERAVDRVVEFEAETRRVREFAGSWSEYERLRELAWTREEAAYERYLDERGRLSGLLRDRRAQARAAGRMADRRGTHALMSKVRWADKRLERLGEVEKPWEPWRLQLSLDAASRAGDVVARLDRAVVDRGGFALGPFDLELRNGDRLALVGPNGSGKSTLLGALLGTLPLASGERYVGPGTRLGALEQQREAFAGDEALLTSFSARSRLAPSDARTLLAKFALGDEDVLRAGRSLSPGERTRAGLALLAAEGVNVLVLDEPTNHLDLEAIEELENALASYEGTIVLVTHDRSLLERFEPTTTLALGD